MENQKGLNNKMGEQIRKHMQRGRTEKQKKKGTHDDTQYSKQIVETKTANIERNRQDK